MDDPLVVRRGQRVGHRHGQFEDAVERQPLLTDDGGERPAADSFHHEEARGAGLFDGVHGDDAGVVQGGDRPGLVLEPGEAAGVGGQVRRQDLDGDVAAEARVVGEVHLAHAPRAELAADLVGTESGPGGKRHVTTLAQNENRVGADYSDRLLVIT